MAPRTEARKAPGLRRAMGGVHAWSGLLAAWLLFAIFLTGTASFFKESLSLWMQPELPRAGAAVDDAALVARWLPLLEARAPEATSWTLTLPGERRPVSTAFWFGADGAGRLAVDPVDMTPLAPRETLGGEFFYRFHFQLHYLPALAARWLVGGAAMLMLVALISGIILHKKILRDFFTFRWGKGPRSWMDAHNASAVLGLPFHLMITYTGLVTLMSLYMPWGFEAAYPPEARQQALSELHAFPIAGPAAGEAAPLTDLAALVKRAERDWGADRVGRVRIEHAGDAAARVILWPDGADTLDDHGPRMVFDGVSGERLDDGTAPDAVARTHGVMVGLHGGRFADWSLRWLYAGLGLIGCGMIATGLVLWVAKRRLKPNPPRGLWWVERMNVATLAGLPVAMTAFLWANRLLPLEMAERAEGEVLGFFLAWLAMLGHALWRPPARAWREQLWLGSGLFALLPVLNLLTTERGLPQSLRHGDGPLLGVDLGCWALATLLALTARRLSVAPAPSRPRRTRKVTT